MIKKKSVEEIKSLFVNAGKLDFDIRVSGQAKQILKHLEWTDEEWTDFVGWYIANKVVVSGQHIMKFLELKDIDGGK